MIRFVIHSVTRSRTIAMEFESGPEALTCLGLSVGIPHAAVQSFDSNDDIFYRTPHPLSVDELRGEVSLHVPHGLNVDGGSAFQPSSVGHLVLMQRTVSSMPYVSPLASLRALLDAISTVSTALLHADNGNMLLLRRSGGLVEAHATVEDLQTYLAESGERRRERFPDFEASEVVLCGSEADSLLPSHLNEDTITRLRTISFEDYSRICAWSKAAAEEVTNSPASYALLLGAALLVHDIQKTLAIELTSR